MGSLTEIEVRGEYPVIVFRWGTVLDGYVMEECREGRGGGGGG